MNKQPRMINADALLKSIEENRQISKDNYLKADDYWSRFYDGEENGLIIAKEIIESGLYDIDPIPLPTIKPVEEVTKDFLDHIKYGIVGYWARLHDQTDYEKCDGVAFSILTLLDGYSGGMPAYEVRALDDKGIGSEDIGGSLHEQYGALKSEVNP